VQVDYKLNTAAISVS